MSRQPNANPTPATQTPAYTHWENMRCDWVQINGEKLAVVSETEFLRLGELIEQQAVAAVNASSHPVEVPA